MTAALRPIAIVLTLLAGALLPGAAWAQIAPTAVVAEPVATVSEVQPQTAPAPRAEAETPAPAPPAAPATPAAIAPPAQPLALAAPPRADVVQTTPKTETSEVVRLALGLSLAALLPAVVLCMTPFVRLVVVLSMIRHGLGMPETPPNQVLVSLALFLTAFAMAPTLSAVNTQALTPFLEGRMAVERAMDQGAAPLRDFMLRQVRDQDLKAVYDIARQPLPARAREVGTLHLTTAFMLNELRVAFKIGFVVLLPFLLIDLVVSSVLLALGMMMVPPSSIALPIKVLLFVLIDGWSLVLGGVVGSFR